MQHKYCNNIRHIITYARFIMFITNVILRFSAIAKSLPIKILGNHWWAKSPTNHRLKH